MKKRWLLGCSLLLLGSFLWAKTGDTMYVSAEEVELKSGPTELCDSFAKALAAQFSLEVEEKSKFRRALALYKGE